MLRMRRQSGLKTMTLTNLSDIADLSARLRALGANDRHLQHLLRTWAQALPLSRARRLPENFLPAAVRAAWPGIAAELQSLASLRSEHAGADGSARLLVGLHDGQAVEAVRLPRGGLCVSTQAGCAVGCVFCMTGRDGLLRQLGSAEIVAQVALARGGPQGRAVNKVVFMGMGEPAHNLDAVLEAIDLLGTAGAIGHKNLVFSTVGDARVFARLPQGRVKPALALSLHTTDAALRSRLLPRAPQISPAELVEAGEVYARTVGYPIQYQWTLMAGINDGDDEVDGITKLLKGRYAIMNLIPFNQVDGVDFRRPSPERAAAMTVALNRRGILTRLRQSAGQDVDAGCGQLRSRSRSVSISLPPVRAPAAANRGQISRA